MLKEVIQIDEVLRPFSNEAVARLNYLFSEVRFVVVGDTIEVMSDRTLAIEGLQQEISYALFRAKIRHEGSANRSALYSAVFDR